MLKCWLKKNGTDNGLYLKVYAKFSGKELLPTSARSAAVWLALYSLRQHFGPQPKWQSVGRLCLDLAQLVYLSLSLAEPGKIMNIFLFTVYQKLTKLYTDSVLLHGLISKIWIFKTNFVHMSQDYLFSIKICFSKSQQIVQMSMMQPHFLIQTNLVSCFIKIALSITSYSLKVATFYSELDF